MKKFLAVLCMITCIFGLTACGTKEASVKESSQNNIEKAEYIATELMVPTLLEFADDELKETFLEEFSPIEAKAIFEDSFAETIIVELNGGGIIAGINSFNSSCKDMGTITEIGEASSEVIKDEIFVYVPIVGEEKSATAEFIFQDNIFLTLDSVALNTESNIAEKMEKAALNTLLGMGTVFSVLILISIIIACFGFIPKLQKSIANKNKKEASVNNTIAQIIEKEEGELVDDLELIAVISAAIAASAGARSTDGFVVRSIKRANTNKWQKA